MPCFFDGTNKHNTQEIGGMIFEYGSITYAPGGATQVYMDRKARNRAIAEVKKSLKAIERAYGTTLLLNRDDEIIETYKNK